MIHRSGRRADVEAYAAWRQERAASVTGAAGNLALVDYEPVGEQWARLETLPASALLDRDAAGVRLRLDADAGASIDGVPVTGEVVLGRLRPDGRPLPRLGTRTVDAFSLDGTDYELRIYDSTAATLADFDRIDCYPYDPAWVLTGEFRAAAQTERLPWGFTRPSDTGHAKTVPGAVRLVVAGEAVELIAFLDGEHAVLVFADGTTGAESYQPGRFLRFPCPAATGPVTVDFNRAFIPPCGFSAFYSCPIPPPQNRISAPVRAGERAVLWHGDAGRDGPAGH